MRQLCENQKTKRLQTQSYTLPLQLAITK